MSGSINMSDFHLQQKKEKEGKVEKEKKNKKEKREWPVSSVG